MMWPGFAVKALKRNFWYYPNTDSTFTRISYPVYPWSTPLEAEDARAAVAAFLGLGVENLNVSHVADHYMD